MLWLPDTDVAPKVIAPSLDRSRPVVASALSLTTATVIEIPTPVLPLAVDPVVAVVTWSLSDAVALKSPVRAMPPALPAAPTVASVSLSVMAIAITGVIAVAPAAPPVAAVAIVCAELAPSVRLCAPLRATPSAICASVSVCA